MELSFIILGFGGILAGILGGLLGIGGGILIMPLLRFIIGLDPASAAGTCIIAVFFTTLGGSLKHYKLGHIHFGSVLPVIVSGLISTFIFSILFFYISHKGAWLDALTGIIFFFVSLRIIWEGVSDYLKKKERAGHGSGIQGSIYSKTTIGAVAGILPGLLGIGTGAVLVPAFAFALNAPIKIAIGSSLACFNLNALVSSMLKLHQGFVQWNLLIPLCIGTFIGARFGAALNGRMSSPLLKLLFGTVFLYVAWKYLI